MRNIALLLCLSLLFLGCSIELAPIDAAYTAPEGTWPTEGSASKPSSDRLSPKQIQNLSVWITQHNDGWKYKVTDVPTGRVILLKLSNGKSTAINLLGDALWIGNRYRLLNSEERASFLALLKG